MMPSFSVAKKFIVADFGPSQVALKGKIQITLENLLTFTQTRNS